MCFADQVVMTLASIPLMDRTGRRTLHLYGLGGMFIFSIFITISFLIKASTQRLSVAGGVVWHPSVCRRMAACLDRTNDLGFR